MLFTHRSLPSFRDRRARGSFAKPERQRHKVNAARMKWCWQLSTQLTVSSIGYVTFQGLVIVASMLTSNLALAVNNVVAVATPSQLVPRQAVGTIIEPSKRAVNATSSHALDGTTITSP